MYTYCFISRLSHEGEISIDIRVFFDLAEVMRIGNTYDPVTKRISSLNAFDPQLPPGAESSRVGAGAEGPKGGPRRKITVENHHFIAGQTHSAYGHVQ